MAYSGANIGTAVAISTGSPSTPNGAGYAAMTWTTVIGCVKAPAWGDDAADINVTPLDGRTVHLIGAIDGGASNEFQFRSDELDTGQILLRSVVHSTSQCSVRITEADGKIEYCTGLWANLSPNVRDDTTWKGFIVDFRANVALVRV